MKLLKAYLNQALRYVSFDFSEVKDITCVTEVQALRECVYTTLEEHVKRAHPDQPGRFAKLLLRLPALRSIGKGYQVK